MGLLTQMAVFGGEKTDRVADRGYFKIEDIEACEKAGIEPTCNVRSAVPQSGRPFSARMSSNVTQQWTSMFTPRVVLVQIIWSGRRDEPLHPNLGKFA
jgi:hypothetical protein